MAGQQQPRPTLQDKATDKLSATAFQQLEYRCCLSHVVPVRTNNNKQQTNKLYRRLFVYAVAMTTIMWENSTDKPQAKCVCAISYDVPPFYLLKKFFILL